MTYLRLPYEDAATTTEMASDCAAVGRALQIPVQHGLDELSAQPQPDFPSPRPVVVSDELAQLAAGLELHFD